MAGFVENGRHDKVRRQAVKPNPTGGTVYRFRIFTLEEANRVLPVVIDLTQNTQGSLRKLRAQLVDPDTSTDELEDETRALLNKWFRLVLEIGAQPKGIFTVDFRSPDPNVLWCWSPNEERIGHRHFTWETFKDRVSIDAPDLGWPSYN